MNELPVDELRKAEALIVDGRLQEASSILANFIHGHAESAEGWFLLSFVAPERARQVECLERALKLDPWMPRAGLRLAQLSQPSTAPNPRQGVEAPNPRQGVEAPKPVQAPPENPPKVSPFFDNDFNFSDEGAFQPAPQAPKSWFDDLQTPQLIVPLEAYPQPGAPLQPEPQETEEELTAQAEDAAALGGDQFPHLAEDEELVDMAPPVRKPGDGQLTRDQKIWMWVGVIIFLLLLISFGILYIGTLSVMPTTPPTLGFAALPSSTATIPSTPTITATLTPLPTATPSLTPTFIPSGATTMVQLDKIQADKYAHIDDTAAKAAAAVWGGDNYQVYFNSHDFLQLLLT